MIRKPPLRTYSKKNVPQPYVLLYKEPIVGETSRKQLQLKSPTADSEENDNINNSGDYDPFDTTFDKLLKSTRTQTQPPLTSEIQTASTTNNSDAFISSDDTYTELLLPSSLRDREDTNSKPAGRDGLRPRNEKKLQKKSHALQVTRIHHKIDEAKKKKPKVTKQNRKKQKKDGKDKRSTNDVASDDITSQGVAIIQSNTRQITDCFIKLTQLSIEEYSSEKKSNAMISSTPVGRLRKSVTCNISFSPIDGSSVKEHKMMKQYDSMDRETIPCNEGIDSANTSMTQIHKDDTSNDKNLSEFKNSREERNNILCIPSVLINSNPSNLFKKDVDSSETSNENISFVVPTHSNHDVQSNLRVLKDEGSEASDIRLELKNESKIVQHTDRDNFNQLNVPDAETQDIMLHDEPMPARHALSATDASQSLFDDTTCYSTKLNNSQDENKDAGTHCLNSLQMNSLHSDAESDKSVSLFGSSKDNNKLNQQETSLANHESNELNSRDAMLRSMKSIEGIDGNDDATEYKAQDILDNTCSAGTESLNDTPNEKTEENIEPKDVKESYLSPKSIDETSEKFLTTENPKNSVNASHNEILEECRSLEPYVLLTRLENPVHITGRRKRCRNWDLQLTNILEDQDETAKLQKTRRSSIRNVESNQSIGDAAAKLPSSLLVEDNVTEEDECSFSIRDRSISEPARTLYLKPGKSWARSLSILNNIQSGANLNKLSIGKGKKWRHSVKDILDMQNQGAVLCCVKKQDTEKEFESNDELLNRQSAPVCGIFIERKSYNPNRFSRRISVRVVPDNKGKKSGENAAFLVACNITSRDSRESLTQHAREVSVYNVTNGVSVVAEANAEKIVLGQCHQENYIPFTNCFSEEYLEHCRKIGEGVYGEVFLHDSEEQKSVIKIIPIEGSELVNGEPQKKFNEILSEIVIAKELHNLRYHETYNTSGFVEVKNIRCIMGKYPERLIELWKIYDEEKNSDNDCPVMFNENQLYIALELGHGGQDLEAFVFLTAEEAYFSFIQTALALAVAEKSLEFEHRDLHWGNILIARTDEQYIPYKFNDKNIVLPTKGIRVSIIDFTLSRVSYQGCYIYNDLALDPALFTAQGEYQFEIYRLMRERIQNNWQKFEPYTNILWLHYTLDKMITAVRYKKKTTKVHKSAILKLKELKDNILSYDSASDFIVNCDKLSDVLCDNASLPSTRARDVSSNK